MTTLMPQTITRNEQGIGRESHNIGTYLVKKRLPLLGGEGRGENREKTVKRGVNERQRWRKPEVTGGHGLKMINLDQSDVHHM